MLFHQTEQALSKDDLNAAGAANLPTPFIDHYLKNNGGIPDDSWFPANDQWDALCIQEFFPIKYHSDSGDSPAETLEGKRALLLSKGLISNDIWPFACDSGGNYFCLDSSTGAVYYLPTDASFSKKRLLSTSFTSFLESLTDEDGAYA